MSGSPLPGISSRSNGIGGFVAYVVMVLLSLAPILLLGLYAYRVAAESVDTLVRSDNLAAAAITRDHVAREFQYRINMLRMLSHHPDFIRDIQAHDEDAIRRRLQTMVDSHPAVVRAFVTDVTGRLWSDYPKATESLGENFAHRDWFRGLSEAWKPYVSTVYRRHAPPQILLVAVALPLRDPATDQPVAALVAQVSLDGLTNLIREVKIGAGGQAYLLDHAGVIAAHPTLDLQSREYPEYANVPPVKMVDQGNDTTLRYTDPINNEEMLATGMTANITGNPWVIVTQQPVADAYGPLHRLRNQITAAGVLLAVLMAGLFSALTRYYERARNLNQQLDDANHALVLENSERKRAEAALSATNHLLEERVQERTEQLRAKDAQLLQSQKMEAIGRLAGGVAHDFNNLLTVIIGYSDMILKKVPGTDPTSRKVEEIRKAGHQAAQLTHQLLAFSRNQILQPVRVDLNEVVSRIDTMLRRLIGEDIDFVTGLTPNLHPVMADPGQIEQIIVNLAVNARDAMPNGGKLTIETGNVNLDESYTSKHAEAMPGPHAMIAVTDTGLGMDKATQARIFEPFFTTKGLGRGTGLGLSTVFGIVKQSGGNIWVYSEPGRGTTFKVYLPRAVASGEVAAAATPSGKSTSGSETILLVEDDDSVRTLVRTVLESAGYKVLDTGDVDDAIRICADFAEEIHVLLTDVVLPRMSGRVLAEKLILQRPGMKVIYMSGYTDNAIVHHGVLDPGTAFLEKPISPDMLLRKVRDFIG